MRCLTEDEVKALMRTDEYQNKYNPKFNETIKVVGQAWENLYPEDDRNKNPDNYYVWKSVGDSKTRSAHAERDGKVFCWDNPPDGGHPGEDYNCRCKAEEYAPPLSKVHESQKGDYAYLTFDGKELSFYKNGEKIKSWSAMSGKPDYQCDNYQDVPDKGPIPEGEWLVKQKNHQNFYQSQSLKEQAISHASMTGAKIGKWPGGLYSWGENRVWLEPSEGVDTKGRSNFTIHGGAIKGSAGCIDIPWQTDEFIEEFKKYGKDMVVKVKYPKNTCW